MTKKEKKFCEMYSRCFDASKAYAYAFDCDYKDASDKADELMRNENIREKIRELKTARFNRELIDADDIIGMYIKIAFADLNDFLDFGRKVSVDENGEETYKNEVNLKAEDNRVDTTAISSITSTKSGDCKVTFYDRMKALEWLGKHMGLDGSEEDEAERGIIIVPDVNKEIERRNKDE